ncbi:MAG: GNAT family N-acetyltransferase [Chloroflexi bacterium]|nr:GNAT family N-acetyltransferase [Chloroflexota bacterium]
MNATHSPDHPFNRSTRQPAILPLTLAHAADAARLHILGQPGTFLTALGGDVLTVLYRTLPVSPVGYGYAALGENGQVLGFAAVTTSTGRLFVEMATRRLGQLLPPLLARFTRRPSLILRSAQTLLYPLLAGNADTGSGSCAELLAIMTEPAARSQGIGGALLAAVCAECRSRGVAELTVTVDAANQGARRFYQRHGFVYCKEFFLYGRAMALYTRELLSL